MSEECEARARLSESVSNVHNHSLCSFGMYNASRVINHHKHSCPKAKGFFGAFFLGQPDGAAKKTQKRNRGGIIDWR